MHRKPQCFGSVLWEGGGWWGGEGGEGSGNTATIQTDSHKYIFAYWVEKQKSLQIVHVMVIFILESLKNTSYKGEECCI